MEYFYQFISSFIATVGFGIFFGAPINSIIPTGFAGAVSWIFYYVFNIYGSPITGTFLGAFFVGVLGEALAIKYKKPATVFITPGIVSLVPGAGMYYTMLYLAEDDFIKAASYGSRTFFIAAAIAIGIVVSTVISRTIRRFKRKF